MRLSLFNALATPGAFGAQRPVARVIRFGGFDDEREVDQVELDKKRAAEEAARKQLEDEQKKVGQTHDLQYK